MAKIRGVQAKLIKGYYKTALENKGHTFIENGTYNLNIIGTRDSDKIANKFNDNLAVIYKDRTNQWVVNSYAITTDPGTYWLKNASNVKGTAILVPGQYRGVYKIDKHAGKYEALCQRGGAVKVYRDGNKDEVHDMDPDTIMEGWYGINIHRASIARDLTENVDRWSAGCQVFKSSVDFSEFMKLIKTSAKYYGNSFTYTLINEEDLT